MTYHINAQIVYDYQELKKYGLSIRNVSITCSEHKDGWISITGDLIVIDSIKANEYSSYDILYTVYGKGKELGSEKSIGIPKRSFTTTLFFIPYDEVDKIRISVNTSVSKRHNRDSNNFGRKRPMYDSFDEFQAEIDRRDILQAQMDMLDFYD